MGKISEETFNNWRKPPSDTEETKLANAQKMISEAIKANSVLKEKAIQIFGQGSYANDTNIRLDSDIDINVRLMDIFFFDLPEGKNRGDFQLNSPSDYKFSTFKNSIENALVNKFGRDSIVRRNKCITIKGNTSRVQADVIPTFNYHRYSIDGSYIEGTKFFSDDYKMVVNFPNQHLENGKSKNSNTSKKFKRLVRVFKKLKNKMVEDGSFTNDHITSFLIESLIWNIPVTIFNDNDSWTERVKSSLVYLYGSTKEKDKCKEWGEVSELLYLFHSGRKWTIEDVNNFVIRAYNYLEF